MKPDVREPKWILLVLMLFFIVQSCAGTKSRQIPKPVQEPAQAATRARQHMSAGEYQKAIDDYMTEYRSGSRTPAQVTKCVKGLENIKAAADKASDKEDFASAGRIYEVLLKNFSHFKDFVRMLSFDRAHLNEKFTHCKKSLSAQGFQEYRKGNLSKAIALWQSLLAIDPDNADIKGAVRTAKLQKKNLQDRAAGQ